MFIRKSKFYAGIKFFNISVLNVKEYYNHKHFINDEIKYL